jgi:hypothetical protein
VGSDGEDNGGMRATNPLDALKDTAASKGFDFVLTKP